ncbi:hypothetical protein AB0H83_15290 [Dactylosporangium sp. NPDC050688]|uniref:hypothetical protein n=1 Tax=Dactylosporangium sp. NPDC050688 TaxID=3157217 RepID=UPI0033D03078
MRLLTLAAGFATGYVLGTRAGRGKYEQIVEGARQLRANPTFAQAQATARNLATSPAATGSSPSVGSSSAGSSSAGSPGAKHLAATSSGAATPSASPATPSAAPKAPRKASATTGKADPLA